MNELTSPSCEVVCPALVLSGGGVRGAYEVGVIAGIVEVLGLRPDDEPPFRIFAGTSVGAINATFLAAHTARGDLGVRDLCEIWRTLELRHHLHIDPLGLFGRPLRKLRDASPGFGRSVLNPKPLERLVRRNIPWGRLHEGTASGATHALVVAALDVGSGRTTMFAELAPTARFRMSQDPRRRGVVGELSADHVLASAALPLMFPARRIGNRYYCDGGLRFNTPIAPAIRLGAERMVVVSLRHDPEDDAETPVDHTPDYPSIPFLLGKLLNALLLDSVTYDLHVLRRFNRLLEVLEETLTPEELRRVNKVLEDTRGVPYRKIDALEFRPSEDIGALAADFVHTQLSKRRLPRLSTWLLRAAAHTRLGRDSDLASYILFDGEFAGTLIDLGRADARARADRIREFFTRR